MKTVFLLLCLMATTVIASATDVWEGTHAVDWSNTLTIEAAKFADMKVGDTFTAFVPAFNKDIQLKVYSLKDEGSYAVWRATKANGQYDLKTFEVKARPVEKFEGLRPGMSLVIKN
jgi:HlyD family secretion protein